MVSRPFTPLVLFSTVQLSSVLFWILCATYVPRGHFFHLLNRRNILPELYRFFVISRAVLIPYYGTNLCLSRKMHSGCLRVIALNLSRKGKECAFRTKNDQFRYGNYIRSRQEGEFLPRESHGTTFFASRNYPQSGGAVSAVFQMQHFRISRLVIVVQQRHQSRWLLI